MKCSEAAPLLSALADDELSPAERAELQPHLLACADCRRTLQIFRAFEEGVAAALPARPTAPATVRHLWPV